jgi:DNA-directed RNA polymerase specialized sigma24 family protein
MKLRQSVHLVQLDHLKKHDCTLTCPRRVDEWICDERWNTLACSTGTLRPAMDDASSTMTNEGDSSVSEWLRHLESGDGHAAQQLWDHFFDKLVRQAENRLRNCPLAATGPEDIVVSVFESLWRGAREGRLKKVQNRDELWWLLLAITHRKVVSHRRQESAQKRGGKNAIKRHAPELQEVVSDELPPDYWPAFEDECRRLLSLLRDEQLRQIAVLRLGGCSIQDICAQLVISQATAGRKLRLIRATWENEMQR